MAILLTMPSKLPKRRDSFGMFYQLWMFDTIAKISAFEPTLGRVDGLATCLRGHISWQLA